MAPFPQFLIEDVALRIGRVRPLMPPQLFERVRLHFLGFGFLKQPYELFQIRRCHANLPARRQNTIAFLQHP